LNRIKERDKTRGDPFGKKKEETADELVIGRHWLFPIPVLVAGRAGD
jgi:hypothetical protein